VVDAVTVTTVVADVSVTKPATPAVTEALIAALKLVAEIVLRATNVKLVSGCATYNTSKGYAVDNASVGSNNKSQRESSSRSNRIAILNLHCDGTITAPSNEIADVTLESYALVFRGTNL